MAFAFQATCIVASPGRYDWRKYALLVICGPNAKELECLQMKQVVDTCRLQPCALLHHDFNALIVIIIKGDGDFAHILGEAKRRL
jgi:hypothetical protein